MKTTLIITVIMLFCNISYSQTNFKYSYDAAGNRIKREVKTAATPAALQLSETEEIAEQDINENEQQDGAISQQTSGDAFPVIIYPNPTYGTFTLDLPDFVPGEKGSIRVYNQMGKMVTQQNYVSASQHFDISNVLPDYYIIHIMVNDKLVVKKIIKR